MQTILFSFKEPELSWHSLPQTMNQHYIFKTYYPRVCKTARSAVDKMRQRPRQLSQSVSQALPDLGWGLAGNLPQLSISFSVLAQWTIVWTIFKNLQACHLEWGLWWSTDLEVQKELHFFFLAHGVHWIKLLGARQCLSQRKRSWLWNHYSPNTHQVSGVKPAPLLSVISWNPLNSYVRLV